MRPTSHAFMTTPPIVWASLILELIKSSILPWVEKIGVWLRPTLGKLTTTLFLGFGNLVTLACRTGQCFYLLELFPPK